MSKTYSAKPSDVTRVWHIIDAAQAPLGRIAGLAATRLMGKHKPQFTSHIDCGDSVIVINSDKLVVTGKKLTDKIYYRHSGFPGGIKQRTLAEQLALDSRKVVVDAVKGMLPKNKLQEERLSRLKVYPGPDHPHEAQQPVTLEVA